jgi:hypothetical protein
VKREREMGEGNNKLTKQHMQWNRAKRNRSGMTALHAAVKRRTYLESRWMLMTAIFCKI